MPGVSPGAWVVLASKNPSNSRGAKINFRIVYPLALKSCLSYKPPKGIGCNRICQTDLTISFPKAKGACVIDDGFSRKCKFLTREECQDLQGKSDSEITIEFHEGFLCSAASLGTICGPSQNTKCIENDDQKCVLKGDKMNDYIQRILEADGILLGSPTYFANISSKMKALIDRVGFVAKANGDSLKRKIGAGVIAVRRQGACHVFSGLNYFFLINQMIVPGSSYWNLGIGLEPGDIQDDKEGKQTFENLGKNMAWLLKKIA